VIPQQYVELIRDHIAQESYLLQYSRINMCLAELIEGDFFNSYIKTGILSLFSLIGLNFGLELR
jgi:hypothetical protein